MPIPEEIMTLIRAGMKQSKNPTAGNKVYKDESAYCFSTPFSPEGLFVNLSNWLGCSTRFMKVDSERSGGNIL